MSMKLFDVVSIEDYTPAEVMMDITEVIGMEDADNDVALMANEIETGINSMEASAEAADMLAAQIAVEEAILDAGTATYGIAQLANVSLQNTAALVGINPERFAISNESMESNPTTALRVSVESAKETFNAIIEKIKAFFSRMWSKMKKMYVKLALTFTNYEKKFVALQKSADELTGDFKEGVSGKFSDSEGKKIASKFTMELITNGGKLAIADLNKKYGSEALKASATYIKDLISVMETSKSGDISKQEEVTKTLAALSTSYDGMPAAAANTDIAIIDARKDGTTISGVKVTVDIKDIGKNQYSMLKFTPFKATAKKDLVEKYAKDIPVLKLDEIKALVGNGLSLAKKKEEFVKYADDILSNTDKAISKKPKAKEDADQDRLDSLYASSLTSVNTGALRFSSNMLLGYLGTLKNYAFLVQVSMSKYKAKTK